MANAAIAQLAGWQTQAARKTLEANKEKLGSDPDFKTAWALLEIQEAAAAGKAAPGGSTTTLAQMPKTQNGRRRGPVLGRRVLLPAEKEQRSRRVPGRPRPRAPKRWWTADPTNATAQFYLGAALVRQKKYDPALKALRLAVRGGFNEAMVNQQIGFIYLFQQKWKEAKDAFDLGLTVDPRFAPMYFWRAMAWDKLGRKDNLLLDLDRYVKLAPNGPEAGKAKAILKSAGG